MKQSKERPYILFVAEIIYSEISKIKKNNPELSNIEAIDNFIAFFENSLDNKVELLLHNDSIPWHKASIPEIAVCKGGKEYVNSGSIIA